jgi:hypothetical protein
VSLPEAGCQCGVQQPSSGAFGNILIDRSITKYIIYFVIATPPARVGLFDK